MSLCFVSTCNSTYQFATHTYTSIYLDIILKLIRIHIRTSTVIPTHIEG
jgi:hypothetical protein